MPDGILHFVCAQSKLDSSDVSCQSTSAHGDSAYQARAIYMHGHSQSAVKGMVRSVSLK